MATRIPSLSFATATMLGAALAAGCVASDNTTTGTGGGGGQGVDPNGNPDGDCMTNAEEAALGTDPMLADTDADGFDDCAERDCVSDPLNASEQCYACGWHHDDPGDLVSDGSNEGNVIANMDLIDQCSEPVKLWDFAGKYHILFMTASW